MGEIYRKVRYLFVDIFVRICVGLLDLLMAALWYRAGHYIFALWVLSIFFFFPPQISAAADWMSTILPHMVCPSANLECRSEMCCTRLAGNAGHKKSPFWHHRPTLSGYIFGTKACIDNRKKLLNSNTSSRYPDGELRPTNG